MRDLYARFILWLIRPALKTLADRESHAHVTLTAGGLPLVSSTQPGLPDGCASFGAELGRHINDRVLGLRRPAGRRQPGNPERQSASTQESLPSRPELKGEPAQDCCAASLSSSGTECLGSGLAEGESR